MRKNNYADMIKDWCLDNCFYVWMLDSVHGNNHLHNHFSGRLILSFYPIVMLLALVIGFVWFMFFMLLMVFGSLIGLVMEYMFWLIFGYETEEMVKSE